MSWKYWKYVTNAANNASRMRIGFNDVRKILLVYVRLILSNIQVIYSKLIKRGTFVPIKNII